MCGISAIFAYRDSAVDRDELEAITQSMYSRGPDAGGTWISPHGRVGLGSRRLAIIDLSDEGTQPMFDVEQDLAIVFNGEIYNHVELRTSLERGGARFHSHTDTEVLLQLYRRDGEAMLGVVRGMYAFAIWDTRTRRMFVARDPYGIKPLYVADDGRTVRIASEVKALLAGGKISREIDPRGKAGFFLTGSVPEPYTIRKDIKSVEAGTCFYISEDHGRTAPKKHYSIAEVFRDARDRREYARLAEPEIVLRERIEESVRHHLVSDVPVGVFLSSGIDSSAVATMATRLSREPLRTFTLTFSEFHGKLSDEAPLAERFAKELGTQHTTRIVTRDEFLADLPHILAAMDQPTIDGVNTWFVSKAVHEAGLKVALSGTGGDELLGSYPSFRNIPRMTRIAPTPLGRAARFLRHPKARLLPKVARSYEGAYFLQRGLFMPDEIEESGFDVYEHFSHAMEPDPKTPYGRVATLEGSLYMRNQLLRDSDWASMAHSVEVRTPLVDAVLLRQIAPVLLEVGRDCKGVLGAMLPDWLRYRPKTGFFIPVREWMDLPPDGTSMRMRSWAKYVFEHAFA
jgi:asparagine synthase (glutamine-hydrolysing)